MTKVFNFALKIKASSREGGTCEVLRPYHPSKIWNVRRYGSHQETISRRPKQMYSPSDTGLEWLGEGHYSSRSQINALRPNCGYYLSHLLSHY